MFRAVDPAFAKLNPDTLKNIPQQAQGQDIVMQPKNSGPSTFHQGSKDLKILFVDLILCVCVCVPECMCIYYMYESTQGSWKKVSDLPGTGGIGSWKLPDVGARN